MMFQLGEAFEYHECGNCGCLQIVEIPPDISRYYPSEYYSLAQNDSPGVRMRMKRARGRYLRGERSALGWLLTAAFGPPVLPAWAASAGLGPGDRILDVGSGTGKLVMRLHEAGYRDVTGIDPHLRGDIFYSPGARVLKQGLEAASGEYDFVMLHHSLEHMPDQTGALGHVYRLLRPGGRALVRIPVVPSYAWQHFGTDWVQLDAPRHLYLHSRESLERVAAQAGLRLERVVYDSSAFQFWGSLQYRRHIPLKDPRSYAVSPKSSIFKRSDLIEFERKAQRLNEEGQGDQACFYLRKSA